MKRVKDALTEIRLVNLHRREAFRLRGTTEEESERENHAARFMTISRESIEALVSLVEAMTDAAMRAAVEAARKGKEANET